MEQLASSRHGKIHKCELSLPMSPVMTEEEVQYVIETLNKWKNKEFIAKNATR